MISTANLTMQFGAKPLFENVSVKFGSGNRYGLIGANGCGKSTLLKILAKEIEPTSGNVSIDTKIRVGQLNQNQFAFEQHTVIDTVMMGFPELWQVKSERDAIYTLVEMTEEDGIKAANLEAEFATMDGYTAESRASKLLISVGIPLEQHNGLMSAVAPGWKLRVLLVQALFADPDILLLDEPTNNLDIDTIRWLEEELNKRNSTMIIISHDRHFLNSVCTHMADLDYGELRVYPGIYDEYMIAATQARNTLMANNAKKKAQIAKLQTFVSRFSANASKARQATARANQIEKIQLEDVKPSSRLNPYIRFEQGKQLYRVVLEVKGLTKSFDEQTIFRKFNLMMSVGERIAILGTNGIGKTTLIRTLLGEIKRDAGTVKWSENANIGYFAQDLTDQFPEDMSLFDWMNQWRQENDDEQVVRGVLGKLLFSQNSIDKSVKVVSGGEQRRLVFGKLMLQRPNIIVMDEPTNHLDMESIESLNTALEKYAGTLLFVSHDREFVSSIATRILDMKPSGVVDFEGNYEDYLKQQQSE